MTQTVLLGDIVRVRRGSSPRPIQDFIQNTPGIPWVKIADATSANSRFISKTNEYIKEDGRKNSVSVTPETLIMSNSATPGLPMIMQIDACVHDGWLILDELQGVDRNWLYYYLLNRRAQSAREASGSVFSNLKTDIVRNFKVDLPDIKVQRKISDILWTIDEKIELNRKMNETLEQMGQALFRHYFITNPEAEGWGSETVGSKYNVILGGTPSRATQEYWVDGTIGWINSGKVNEFRIIEPSEMITELALSKSAAKLLPKGTTVLAITGATLGQVSRLENEFAANQSVIGVVPSSHFTNEFAYFWINHNINKIIGHQTGGAQQHINKSNVSSFELIVPPPAELEGFQKEISPIMEKIALQCEEIQNLTNLRNSLLPRLISGVIKL